MTPDSSSRVLIVDDDANLRALLTRGLSGEHEVVCAADAREAEARLAERAFKVIVCDDQMPGETGLMFLARMRARLTFTQFILLTGNGAQDALVFAINEAHVFRYLLKPVSIPELRQLVREGVEKHDLAWTLVQSAEESHRLRTTVAKHLQGGEQAVQAVRAHERQVWWRVLGTGGLVLSALFAAGICVLVALYVLKSWLGIDFFENMHVWDLL